MNYSTNQTDPTINPALRAQVRAFIEKNGIVRVNADDPLATDKIRVDRWLRNRGRTSDDLPPNYWSLDKDERGSILGEIQAGVNAEDRAAERLARMVAAGYPADYPLHSRDDQRRISDAVRQRRARLKKATAAAATPKTAPAVTPRAPRGIPFEIVSREWCDDRLTSLTAWTADSGPQQRQLRGHERELVKAALIYQVLARELHRAPSYGELAAKMRRKRDAARNLVRRLESLYSVTGPWHSKA
jgi:hypothetical protein